MGPGSGVGVSNNSRTWAFVGLARWYSFPLRLKNRGYETLQLEIDGLHTFAASTRSERVRTLTRQVTIQSDSEAIGIDIGAGPARPGPAEGQRVRGGRACGETSHWGIANEPAGAVPGIPADGGGRAAQ